MLATCVTQPLFNVNKIVAIPRKTGGIEPRRRPSLFDVVVRTQAQGPRVPQSDLHIYCPHFLRGFLRGARQRKYVVAPAARVVPTQNDELECLDDARELSGVGLLTSSYKCCMCFGSNDWSEYDAHSAGGAPPCSCVPARVWVPPSVKMELLKSTAKGGYRQGNHELLTILLHVIVL